MCFHESDTHNRRSQSYSISCRKSRLLLNVVILILTMAVPVRASESGDQTEEDTFPPEAGFPQSRRKSWQNGFGSTTVINEMVMMLPQPIEATSSWLILVSLMVCVLTATLTSYWTVNTVKDMLKKWPCGEPSSTSTNESDLATEMTDNSDVGATVMPSPTTSPPRSPRNQRRDQESEAGYESNKHNILRWLSRLHKFLEDLSQSHKFLWRPNKFLKDKMASVTRKSKFVCSLRDVDITDSDVAWYAVILEEYEDSALQKQFKEAADLVVNAVPLNLVRTFGVDPKGWLINNRECRVHEADGYVDYMFGGEPFVIV